MKAKYARLHTTGTKIEIIEMNEVILRGFELNDQCERVQEKGLFGRNADKQIVASLVNVDLLEGV